MKAPDLLKDLDGLEASRSNRLVVKLGLGNGTTCAPDVFAIGDCAFLITPGETRPVAPRAQAAHQQGRHLAKDRYAAGSRVRRWSPSDKGISGRSSHS